MRNTGTPCKLCLSWNVVIRAVFLMLANSCGSIATLYKVCDYYTGVAEAVVAVGYMRII